jgi:glycyl-tRNA synthetase beta chain
MPADLLFEIGSEEIPAGFLARAIDELSALAARRLGEARLEYQALRVMGTPRRLVLVARSVADRQPDVSEQVVGPPAGAAFDSAGAPTKAAVGFARRNGVDVSELSRAEVPGKKGEYVVCTRREAGKPAVEVLPGLLAGLMAELPWPKSMRWASREDSFVRPVHWILALYGDEVLAVEFAGQRAGRMSRGHRFLAPAPIEIHVDAERGEDAYQAALRAAFVIVDPDGRRDMIAAELGCIEEELGVRVRRDASLLGEVTYLVEYPKAVCGTFDASYLELPEEVIVSAMRSHQRYFAMENADGALANRFVTIAGTITRDLDVVKAGNERVLAARLSDAMFFFREDRKRSLDEYAARLGDVVFQARLGSIGAKVERIRKTAAELSAEVGLDSALVDRACALCKADLVSQMVFEFPDLQGVMGAHYARLCGEPAEVAAAIREHYLPRGAGDALPGSEVGAVVAIADRIDTLVGCFAVGLAPSGSADPYGLRRAALGILAILLHRGWSVPLSMLVHAAAASLEGKVEVGDESREEVLEFLRTRLKGMLGEDSEADCVEAALSAGFDYVPDARARARAVSALRRRPDFEPLAVAFKRVANILKGEMELPEGGPRSELFALDEERALWAAFGQVESRAAAHLAGGDYTGALAVLAELKEPVDRFFDAVLVMDKDAGVRGNRLAMLARINATFTRIADFRQLAV